MASTGTVCVYNNEKKFFSGAADQDYFRHFDLDNSYLVVRSSNEYISVIINGKEYLYTGEGINVLVYDKAAEDMIDGTGFDAEPVPYF